MSKRPWMPIYIADFLTDTTHLDATESGAYLLLIFSYWTNGSLPSDERKLARIARMTTKQWNKSKPTLELFFDPRWGHRRIDSELAKVSEISNKRKAAALQKHSISSANAPTLHTIERKKDKNPASAVQKIYAFESGVIKLNQRDFDQWSRAFSNLNLPAELLSMAEWAGQQRNWFNAVKNLLNKRDKQAKLNKEKEKTMPFKWNGIEGVI